MMEGSEKEKEKEEVTEERGGLQSYL